MLLESLNTSVSVNGLYVLARGVQNMLGQYSFNLFVWTHDETNKVSLLGSATPLHYRGEFLLICTRHQIKDINHRDVIVVTEDGELALTSSGYSVPVITGKGMQNDLQDIVVFNFNNACAEQPTLQRKFFNFGEFPPVCMSDKVVAVLNYGYPSEDQVYELHDNNHIGSRRRATTLNAHGQPQDETLLHLKPQRELSFDPDGLSGGPNFTIQRSGKDLTAYFAGITVRAGRKDVYIVKSDHIKGLLDAAIDSWT